MHNSLFHSSPTLKEQNFNIFLQKFLFFFPWEKILWKVLVPPRWKQKAHYMVKKWSNFCYSKVWTINWGAIYFPLGKELQRKSCLDKKTAEKFTAKAWIHLSDVTATHGEVNTKQIVFLQTLVLAEMQNTFRFWQQNCLLVSRFYLEGRTCSLTTGKRQGDNLLPDGALK